MKRLKVLIKSITLASITLGLAACATFEETRLNSSLTVKEFNSVYSTYADRPTFVKLYDYGNGINSVLVEMDTYHPSHYSLLNFGVDYAKEYIAYIDKYLEWENIASKRGDMLTKEIGSSYGQGEWEKYTFSFYSGNSDSHYLEISNCSLMCVEGSTIQYYDVAAAKELRRLLVNLESGNLKTVNTEEIYQ
ncbi:hypothetical protein [Vibrio alginolyticus]